jgi:hypothetical protein
MPQDVNSYHFIFLRDLGRSNFSFGLKYISRVLNEYTILGFTSFVSSAEETGISEEGSTYSMSTKLTKI